MILPVTRDADTAAFLDGTAVGEDQCGLTWWSTGWTLSVCDEDDKAYCFVECYPVEPSGVAN